MENGNPEMEVETSPGEKLVANNEVEMKEIEKNYDEKATEKSGKPSETPEQVTPELLEKIKTQIEFYFGDVNMRRDKFLIEQSEIDEGWIPMSILLKFKALASISTNVETIFEALENSNLVEFSEDGSNGNAWIRRCPDKPLPVYDDAYRRAQDDRTVYCGGFPLEGVTLQILQDFFKDFGAVENIIMRKNLDKDKKHVFNGSIYVQFKTLEGANAFMARESVKYGDKELIRKPRKIPQKRRTEMKTVEELSDGIDLPRGAVLHFEGAPNEVKRELITVAFSQLPGTFHRRIAFFDFSKGDTEGIIRFVGENTAKKCFARLEGGKLVFFLDKGKCTLNCRVLEGDEEEQYLKKVRELIIQKRKHIAEHHYRLNGHDVDDGGKKRAKSSTQDEPPKKAAKSS